MRGAAGRLAIVVMVALGGRAGVDGGPNDATERDRELYAGTWQVVSIILDGRPLPAADCQKLTVINQRDGSWALQENGKNIALGTSTIWPAKRPKAIDLVETAGGAVGRTVLGIYEVGASTRKLCLAQQGQDRPREFSSNPGSGRILVSFQRRSTPPGR